MLRLASTTILTLSALALLACSSDPQNQGGGGTTTTSSTGTTSHTGSGGTGTTTSSSHTGGGGTGGALPAAVCEAAGGICMAGGSCASAGGTVPASSPGGCAFDDGPAECCVPPAPKPSPTTCAEAGGLCAPLGGCFDAGGALTSTTAGCDLPPPFTCCLPHSICGDATIECCTDTTIYRPSCDGGKFVCTLGTAVPAGTCKVP